MNQSLMNPSYILSNNRYIYILINISRYMKTNNKGDDQPSTESVGVTETQTTKVIYKVEKIDCERPEYDMFKLTSNVAFLHGGFIVFPVGNMKTKDVARYLLEGMAKDLCFSEENAIKEYDGEEAN